MGIFFDNMATKQTKSKSKSPSIMARSDDGSIQITFTIPFKTIKKKKEETALELGKDIVVPGFRKGNAPLDKLVSHIPDQTLLEKTLNNILPKLFSDAVTKYKIKPAVYPKFELLKSNDNEDWQIRAQTAEIPDIQLGDYKKEITGATRAKNLWIPGKDKNEKKEPTQAEKEQEVIKILLKTINVKVPKMLIDDEVNSRLSKLLERIEKLGLTLEAYLASIGKTADDLRNEYEKQSNESITIDLVLQKIADKEKIDIPDEQITKAIGEYSKDEKIKNELQTKERKVLIKSMMKKRAALDTLVSIL